MRPERVGWREASTFRGFCDVHDALFGPLDRVDSPLSPEKCFLLLYRSAAFELYRKAAAHASFIEDDKLLARSLLSADVRELVEGFHEGTALGLRDITNLKAQLDRDLVRRNFADWRHVAIQFDGSPAVACAGGYGPLANLQGIELQDFFDPSQPVEFIGLSTLHRSNTTIFVLSWHKASRAGAKFSDSLLQFPEAELPHVAAQLPFLCLENTYFAPNWWNTRRKFVKDAILRLAITPSPFTEAPQFLTKHVTDWTLTDIHVVAPA